MLSSTVVNYEGKIVFYKNFKCGKCCLSPNFLDQRQDKLINT